MRSSTLEKIVEILRVKEGGTKMYKKDVNIRMVLGDEEILIKMYDNSSSRDFISQLPMKLKFEDYASTEKVANLPKKLSLEGVGKGTEAAKGDFTYYSPWGNLAIFYKDFGYASGLVKLGHIEKGLEKLLKIKNNAEIIIEKVD